MVSEAEFSDAMTDLHQAFGAVTAGEPGERLRSKIRAWYRIWRDRCWDVSPKILTAMVKRAIADCERIPSFAQFLAMRQQVMTQMPMQGYAHTPCSVCNSSGLILATRNEEGYGMTEYQFRCHCCENWQGKYDGLPIWLGESKFEIAPKMCFDPSDRLQIKGLALLRTAAPKLYAKIIAKHPEMVETASQIEVGEIVKTVPGEHRDPQENERVRRQSLRQDEMEEAPF